MGKASPSQSNAALGALTSSLGSSVMLKKEDRYAASMDNLRLSVMPDAVVRPADEVELKEMLRLANKYGVPVTTRGGGSAATGATTPLHGGWVLDLSHWQSIDIDTTLGLAKVHPGVRTAALQRAAEAEGLFYPPDPSSAEFCTIGGNIATNAGGLRAAKYGTTRDYVVALRGFLPTGEPVRWGAPLKKCATGFNLRDLWIGSEGMLGIITEATLKLIPKPKARYTFLVAFKDEIAALSAIRRLMESRLLPAALEFMDRQTVACAERYSKEEAFPSLPGQALVLIELDGHPSAIDDERKQLSAWAKSEAIAFEEADAGGAERLWRIRRICSQAMFELGDAKLNEDIVIPPQSYEALLIFTQELGASFNLPTPTFGHAADGNFHVHIMYHRSNEDACKRAEEALQVLMEKVIALGGVISGEHGIGLAKSSFFTLQHSTAEIEAMQSIKRALDPKNILNPGKMFTPTRVWDYRAESFRLPWDHA